MNVFLDALSDAWEQMTGTLSYVAQAFGENWRTGLAALLDRPAALFYVVGVVAVLALALSGRTVGSRVGYQRGRFLSANEKSFLRTLDAALGRNYARPVIMRSRPRQRPANHCSRWRSLAGEAAHNSKAHQELHQLVRRTIPMRSGRRRLQSVERALLHGEIRLKVHVRRGGAFMTQPQRDHCDVDARLQEMHRRGVADGVRRYRAAREPGVTLGGGRHRKLQALGDV